MSFRLEFEWTQGVGDAQGSLACCSPWGHKESHRTEAEQPKWTQMRALSSTKCISAEQLLENQGIEKKWVLVVYLLKCESALWLYLWSTFPVVSQSDRQSVSQSVQSLSRVKLFATPWIAAHQASLSITNSWSSLRLMSIESVMPYSHLILGRPLLLLPPIPPNIRVFSNESTVHMRWPKFWSFSLSIIPSKEIPGLISFRMDWL